MKSFSKYVTEQKASDVLKNWRFEDARLYAEKMIKAFGQPDEVAETTLSWNSIEPPFDRVWIVDESIPHDFPAPHRDYVYSSMKMKIPKDDSAYRLLQTPSYSRMGSPSFGSTDFWGTLISVAAVGVLTVYLYNRFA